MRTYSDPALWEHSKEMARQALGGHSARAMQMAGKIYRAAGGRYIGKPTKAQQSLKRWTAQDWTTKSGRPSRETGERYLPRAAIEGLTSQEYAATTRAKRKGTAAGQQFVKQPKRIAAKVARLKGNPTVGKIYSLRISPTIANEYLVRNIGDVIPALGDYEIKPGGRIMVDRTTLDEIIADCEFMADPKAMDASAAERRAYRAMRAVCEQALLKDEPRKENPAMKKPTPAQLAARARFAEMARSGAFKRKAKAAKKAKAAPKKATSAATYSVVSRDGAIEAKGLTLAAARKFIADKAKRTKRFAGYWSAVKTNPRKRTVSEKISQLMHEGYPQKQAVAVALSEQRAGKVKRNPNALLKPVLRLDGWEVSRYKSMDTAIAEARRRAVSDLEYDKPNPKTHYVTKAGRTMYEVTTQPYGDTIVMQVKPADALKLYELGYTSRDFHEQLRTKRKTNPATGRKGSGTKLNPAAKPTERTVYQVQHSKDGKTWDRWMTVMYLPMAKQIAERLAAERPKEFVRVESFKMLM